MRDTKVAHKLDFIIVIRFTLICLIKNNNINIIPPRDCCFMLSFCLLDCQFLALINLLSEF